MPHGSEFGIAPVGGRGKKPPKRLPPPPPAPPAVESSHGYAGATPTPTAPVQGPTRSQSSVPIVREPSKAIARAEARQKQLVTKYVTKAYSNKLEKKGVPTEQINLRIEKAKAKISQERDRLLNHPKVQAANAQGKVVSPKGLQQIVKTGHETATAQRVSKALKPGFASPAKAVKNIEKGQQTQAEISRILTPGGSGKKPPGPRVQTLSAPRGHNTPGYTPPKPMELAVEKDVINPAQEAGVLPKHQTLGQQIYTDIAAWAPLLIPGAEEGGAITKAKSVAEAAKDLPGILSDTRAGLKELPSALKSATEPAALKAAAKAAPKAAATAPRSYQSVAALGALGGAHKAGINLPGGALIEGQAKAVAHDPLKVLGSTANLAPGLLVSAFQLPAAAGKAAIEGSSAPLTGALNEQKNFFEHFAKTYGGSNVKAIEKATLKEGLLPEVLAAPLIAKGIKSASDAGLKDRVLSARADRRAPLVDAQGNVITDEHGIPLKRGTQRHPNETHITRAAENAHLRREEARHAAKAEDMTNVEVGHRTRDIESAARKAAGQKVTVREGLGPKGKHTLQARAPDFIPFLNRAGIDLHSPDAALAEIKHYDQMFKSQPSAADLGADPAHLNARDAVNYFLEHPEKLKDPHLATLLDRYRSMANGDTGLNSLSTSERNRYLGVAAAHDIPFPEHRAYPYLRPPGSDVKTWEDLQHHLESELEGHKANIEARREPTSKGEKGARYGAKPELRAAEAGVRQTRKAAERAKRRVEVAKEQHERDGTVRSRNALEKAERDLARAKGDHKLAVKRAKKARTNLSSAIARKNELERGIKRAKVGHERTKEGGAPPRVTLTEAERKAVNNSLPRGATLRDRKAAHRDAIAKKAAQIRKELEREYLGEVRGVIQKRGLHPEPAYVPDVSTVGRARPDQAATGGEKQPSGPHTNEGFVFKHGLQMQGFEHLMNGVHRSVAVHHWFENARRFRDQRAIEIKGTVRHNGKEWSKAFQGGLVSEKDVSLVPTQVLNRFDRAIQDGTPSEYAEASAALTGAAVAVGDAIDGTQYEAFPTAAWKEFSAQAQSNKVSNILRTANMVTSRAMLSTPSFVVSQIVAETAQAVADTNPVRLAQGLYNYSKLSPAEKAKISGVAGETGRAIFSPNRLGNALLSDGKPMKDALGFFRRNLFGRTMKDIVSMKWAGDVNRLTSGLTRRAVLTGEIMKELNGLQRHGRALLNIQTELQKEIGHLSGKEQLAWVANHPDFLDRFEKKLHAAMGGWTNLTRTGHFPEVYRAAGLVFYPFLRMSVLWPLKFAVNHPLKGTALAYLAAQNNFALREALHGEPSFLNYAQIPLYGRNPQTGKIEATSTMNLSRMSPGGNAITSAIQGTQSPIGATQPVIAATLLGLTGKGPLGEVEGGVGSNLKAAGASILGLSPYVRALDTLRGQKASGQSEFGIFAKRANIAAEPLAALEAKLKGSMGTQLERSLVNPLKPTPINLARDQAKLGRILQTLGENSKSKQGKTSNRAKVLKMQKAGEKAGKELEALYKKYGLSTVAKRDEELYNYSHPYPGSTGGIYHTKSPTESIYSAPGESSNIYSGGEPKAPKIPHETNGISLHLPGLGGITGAITNFLGGTPAQAATLPKGQKAPGHTQLPKQLPNPPQAAHKVSIQGPLTPSQKTFGKELSRLTGLSPKTVGGWLLAEDSGSAASSKESSGDANWLNIGPGYNLGANPQKAAAYTANLINTSQYYGGIRAAAGKGVGPEVAAIRQSPWDGAHYPNGIPVNLVKGAATGKVPRKVVTRYHAAVQAASELNKLHLPYVWGGGHNSGRVNVGSGVDCSGAVSFVLQKMGVKLPGGVVSGDMGQYLKPGPGAVTVFYNSEHTFMKIGDKYFGTSESNPGGGAGFFPTSVGKSEVASGNSAGRYAVGHVAGLGKKVAVALGIPTATTGTAAPQSFPGMTISEGGTTAEIKTGKGTKQKTPGFSNKPIELSPAQRLARVERITSGNLTGLGIPATASVGPSVTDLANIAQTLSKERKRLNVS